MRISFLLLLGVAGIHAAPRRDGQRLNKRVTNDTSGGRPSCPEIWSTISKDLSSSFVSGGECTDLARGAIRYAFHDAATFSLKLPVIPPASGGADGSLLLNEAEIGRPLNLGLVPYHNFIKGKFEQYQYEGIGAADLIQFAGNLGVVSCPGGPMVQTLIGREDSYDQSPDGLLPIPAGTGSDHDTIFQLFQDKGINALDLAALIGAHTTSKASTSPQIPAGTPQDSTPGLWDVKYYSETLSPPSGVQSFEADINLSSSNTTVGKEFHGFVDNQAKWNVDFASAFFRLGLLGISPETYNGFADCTAALPQTTLRRRVMSAPFNFHSL